jgi:hypothetical protein
MPPATSRSKPAPPSGSRLRRFLLLEMPGWAILAVGVSYSIAASGGAAVVFFQAILITAALAWLGGGRTANLQLSSLLFGWAAGSLAWFNLLAMASIGVYLLPVTAYVAVVLVLLLSARSLRCTVAAGGGLLLAVLVQTIFLGLAGSR